MEAKVDLSILDVNKVKQSTVTTEDFREFKVSNIRSCTYVASKKLTVTINYFLLLLSHHCWQAGLAEWGIDKFIYISDLKTQEAQWVPEDNLTLYCDLSLVGQFSKFALSR